MRLRSPSVPLPRQWPKHVKSAFLCAIALAHRAMTCVHGSCAESRLPRVRLEAEASRLRTRLALLEEENRLLRSRLSRVAAPRRPHYLPEERLRILAFKAATGLTVAELAERFLVTPLTVTSWLRRVDEEGSAALLRMREPVHRFPDFVRELVRSLKKS